MNRRFLVAFLLAFVAASALAQEFGRIKVIHAYPTGQATVDIFISSNGYIAKSLRSVPYKAASEWFYLAYGDYEVTITATGQSDAIFSGSLTVNAPSTLAFASDWSGLAVYATSDNVDTIAPGKAHVTVAHFAVGVGAVDVGAGTDFTAITADLGYGSVTDPVPVDAGAITAEVRLTGETAVILDADLTLEARKAYLVVAVGSDGTPAPALVAFELTDYSINARLAFVHGVPADLPVDVIANGALTLFRNVNYKNITDYKNIPVGTHTITVEAAGSAAITVTAFFNGYSESTLYATAGAETSAAGILLNDNNEAPADGKARLRVLHGTGSAPSVDVRSGNTVIIGNLTYGFASEYLALSAMTYSLSVAAAGTTTAVFSVDLAVAAGPVITVLAAGVPGVTSGVTAFSLVVVTDALYGAEGNLRAAHAVAVAGAPNVNIKANGNNVFTNVAYKAVSDYAPVPAGLYRVSIHAASGDAEIFRSPVRVDASGYFTAVAGGEEESLALFQLRDNDARPASGTAHLRVVHASATSPEVNLEVNGAVVGSLIYTEAFGYTPLAASTYAVRVATTDGNTQVFNGSLPLEADTVVSVFAVGVVGDNTNGFTVVPVIDFDYRTPAGPTASPTSTTTPTRTPTRASSAAVATVSVGLMALAALL